MPDGGAVPAAGPIPCPGCGHDWASPGGIKTDERERASYWGQVIQGDHGLQFDYDGSDASWTETTEVFYLCGKCERSIDTLLEDAGVRTGWEGGR